MLVHNITTVFVYIETRPEGAAGRKPNWERGGVNTEAAAAAAEVA